MSAANVELVLQVLAARNRGDLQTAVVDVRFHSRGRMSGVETIEHSTEIDWLEDGRIVRYKRCRDRDEAVRAAGLSSPG